MTRPVIRLTPRAAQQQGQGDDAPRERPTIHLTRPAPEPASRPAVVEPPRVRPVIRCR
ncbi:hypothetical protein [Streptomyces uncialis]|uniref:hypothetical protein n=1 Tax=Streptomyces uncialis TaxID=1048205 RepID=UPI003798E907